tara:strand:+ start:1008 stop:1244 length:237 start_codon:yes stop_codon:yes gene_type:complete
MKDKIKENSNFLIQNLNNSKWSSMERLNGWIHYEVLNIRKANQEIEMLCVCDKSIKVKILIFELRDKKKWLPGWIRIR